MYGLKHFVTGKYSTLLHITPLHVLKSELFYSLLINKCYITLWPAVSLLTIKITEGYLKVEMLVRYARLKSFE